MITVGDVKNAEHPQELFDKAAIELMHDTFVPFSDDWRFCNSLRDDMMSGEFEEVLDSLQSLVDMAPHFDSVAIVKAADGLEGNLDLLVEDARHNLPARDLIARWQQILLIERYGFCFPVIKIKEFKPPKHKKRKKK